MSAPPAKLWIGPSGWSYADWNGVVYPAKRPRGFKPLEYLAQFCNAVEVNSSFYRIPSPRMTAVWPQLVPADFRFTFKLTQMFTHKRAEFPPAEEVQALRDALEPVRAAGRLGPVLMQFPWSFRYDGEAVAWLERLAGAFGDLQRFVEVRHTSWLAPDALEALQSVGGFCNIDQPRYHDCIGPTEQAWGPTAYVRLHGRNYQNWFRENIPSFERYNYLYEPDELREWVQRVNRMAERTHEIYVLTNNHFRGQSVVNALELKAMLTGEPVDAPPTLVQAYPRLAASARRTQPTGLFDGLDA